MKFAFYQKRSNKWFKVLNTIRKTEYANKWNNEYPDKSTIIEQSLPKALLDKVTAAKRYQTTPSWKAKWTD